MFRNFTQTNETWAQPNLKRLPTDFGPMPFVVDVEKATIHNDNFRTVMWTGKYLQMTVMSILAGDDIGLEIHPDHDQFLRIEEGQGLCQMGKTPCDLSFAQPVYENSAIFVPAGTWHNITNTGCVPLKLYSIYAPPDHAHGAVHHTKADAQAEEGH
ncbi:MAG: cupin domain-containing protein [Defluviitaleaceae bacterium]|nr:cupin domain-containing protein [Defluviitaleaceae bacterium]